MVDVGSRAASVTVHRVMDTEHGLGNATGKLMLNTLLNHWVKCYGTPDIVRTDPEGAFRDQGFRRGLAARSIRLDIDPGDASWKTRVLWKTLETIKQSAIHGARRTPDSVKEIFDECTAAHNDFHRIRGFSPLQLLLGKTPTDKSVCENPELGSVQCRSCGRSCETESPCERRVVQSVHRRGTVTSKTSQKEVHQAGSWRHWAASEWCWCWRSG